MSEEISSKSTACNLLQGLVAFFLTLAGASVQAKSYRADLEAYKRPTELTLQFGPLVQDVRDQSAHIVWGTFGGKEHAVALGEGVEGKAFDRSLKAVTQKKEDAKDHWTKTFYEDALIHECEISGLKPDTVYRYRVESSGAGGKSVKSKTHTFRTAPLPGTRKRFRFLLYGDTREKKRVTYHYEVVGAILKEFEKELPSLVLVSGDNANDSEEYTGWLFEFLKPGQELYSRVPSYLAVGNHDVHPIDQAKKSIKSTPGLLRAIFTPPHGEQDFYAFVWDNVKIIVIDTQLLSLKPGSPQRKWLVEQCRRDDKTDWLVVMGHHPAMSSNHRHGEQGAETLPELLEKAKVDVYLCGHNHHYERLVKAGVHYLVGGGGGAQLYGFQDPPDPHSVKRIKTYHYCVFQVEGRRLDVEVKDLDGKTLDTLRLERPKNPNETVKVLKK